MSHQNVEPGLGVWRNLSQLFLLRRYSQAMRQRMADDLADPYDFKPAGRHDVQILDLPENLDSGPDVWLLGSIVVPADYDSGDTVHFSQPVQLFGGNGHDTIDRAHLVKQIARVDAEVGFDRDNLIYRFAERIDNVFLPERETALTAPGMVLPRTEVTIGEMAEFHVDKIAGQS